MNYFIFRVQAWLAYNAHCALGSFLARVIRFRTYPSAEVLRIMRRSGPRGDLVVKNSIEEAVHLSPSTFMKFDETTMSARLGPSRER